MAEQSVGVSFEPRCQGDRRTRRDWPRAPDKRQSGRNCWRRIHSMRSRRRAGRVFDHCHVERRLCLVAARRARQQHAEQPRAMQSLQQRLEDVPRYAISSAAATISAPSSRARATGSGLVWMSMHHHRLAGHCGRRAREPGSPTRGSSTACRRPRSRQLSIAAARAPAQHR